MEAIKRVLWWLIAGSEGGLNRARIIHVLNGHPSNANQLSEELKLDYKTIRHHLDILEKNNMLSSMGSKYGKMFYISPLLEEDYAVFEEIWAQIGKNDLKGKKNRGG